MIQINDIIDLDKDSFSISWSINDYNELLKNKNVYIKEIIVESKLVGFIVLLNAIDVLEIIRIAVNKNYKKNGFGKKLIEIASKKAIELNIDKLILEVREGNTPAINLYQKNCFERISIRKKYYKDNRENAIIFLKRLDNEKGNDIKK